MKFNTQKQIAIISVASILASSTIFFKYIEGWSWFDSFYFSVITMSTVGYGNIIPVTALGKIGVIVLIFTGVGALAFLFQIIASDTFDKRLKQKNHDE